MIEKDDNNLVFSTKSKERKEKFNKFTERQKQYVQKKLSDFFVFNTEKIKFVPVANKTSMKEKVGKIISSSSKKERKIKSIRPTTMRNYKKNKGE